MAKTISELRNQSIQVRDASAAGENTATRVGTVLNDIVGHIEDYENTQSSNNSSQDAKIEGVKSSLNAEIARAKTEESNLSTQIGTERTERQAAVSREETARIQADNDEKTARMAAYNAEQDARIKADNDEKTARENADITLRTMIQTEVSNRQIAVKQEEIRAMAAEKANTQAIEDETTRATTAEADETARATAEEARLQDEIDNTNTNVETLEDKVNSNNDHLTEEVARLDTTDNEIKADLEAETARAKAAEEANAQAITDETARAKAAEEANATAINAVVVKNEEQDQKLSELEKELGLVSSFVVSGRSILSGNWQNKQTDSCYVIPIHSGDIIEFKNSSNGYYGCLGSYSDDAITADWTSEYWQGTGCSITRLWTYTANQNDKYLYVALVLNGVVRTPYEIKINGILLEDIGKINEILSKINSLKEEDNVLDNKINDTRKHIALNEQGLYGVWEGNTIKKTDEYFDVNLKKGEVAFEITSEQDNYADIVMYDADGNIVATSRNNNDDPPFIAGGNTVIVKKEMLSDAVKIALKTPVGRVFSVKVTTSYAPFVNTNKLNKSFEQNIGKSGSKNILYVKKNGGDFADIQSAINSIDDASISNQYEIRVCDDYEITVPTDLVYKDEPTTKNPNANPIAPCAYIVTKDYVDIVGYNRRRKISVKMPDTMAGSSQQYVQVMYLQGNVVIDNIDFEIKNGRYAIHQESGGNSSSLDYHAITKMRNCNVVHLGNVVSGGTSWTAICGQANGSCSGLKAYYDNVNWKPMFYTHNNPNFDAPTHFKFKNCSIIPNIGENNFGGYINTYGSGHNFVIDVEGCNFLGMDNNIDVAPENKLTDACHDIRTHIPTICGQGNQHSIVCRIIYSQYVLCFESNTNNVNVSVTGGTAKSLIFGDTFISYDGATDAHGFVMGTEYIKDNAFTLGKRLGDCSSLNKTLVVNVGGASQTITFDKNYLSMSNADVVADINSKLSGAIAKVTADKDNSMVMYPLKDCYEVGFNYTSSTILAGMPLVRDIGNPFGWKICPVGTKAEGMSCERINPNGQGKVALLKKNLFKTIRDLALGSNVYAKVYSSGYWTGTANKEEADLVQISTGVWMGL